MNMIYLLFATIFIQPDVAMACPTGQKEGTKSRPCVPKTSNELETEVKDQKNINELEELYRKRALDEAQRNFRAENAKSNPNKSALEEYRNTILQNGGNDPQPPPPAAAVTPPPAPGANVDTPKTNESVYNKNNPEEYEDNKLYSDNKRWSNSQVKLEKGDCKHAAVLGKSCGGTTALMEFSKYSDMAGAVAGAVSTNVAGGIAVQKAKEKGTIESNLNGGADTYEAAAVSELSQGALNSGLGLATVAAGMMVSSDASDVRDATKFDASANEQSGGTGMYGSAANISDIGTEGNGMTASSKGYLKVVPNADLSQNAIAKKLEDNYHLNKMRSININATKDGARLSDYEMRMKDRKLAVEEKQALMNETAQTIGNTAADELDGVAEKAIPTGLIQAAKGVKNFVNAYAYQKAAENLRHAADEAGDAAEIPPFDLKGDDLPPPAAPEVPTGGTNLGNNSQLSDSIEDPGSIGDDGPDTLGDTPFPELGNKDIASPPPGVPTNPSGGGGGGDSKRPGISAGNVPKDAQPEDEGPGAQAAEEEEDGTMYGGGPGYRGPANNGGGGKGGGLDLSFLAKLFEKEDKQEKKDDIREVAFNQQKPGNEPDSLLDRDANLFERVHLAYEAKSRSGAIRVF